MDEIKSGDWVEVIFDDGTLPVGNRYRVKANYGKALDLELLDKMYNVLLFKKISGPNAPR